MGSNEHLLFDTRPEKCDHFIYQKEDVNVACDGPEENSAISSSTCWRSMTIAGSRDLAQ